jgi:low temperature requirement protein LtrA
MSEKGAEPAADGVSERHASWLELFFDLVAVAGVAQLAGLIHGVATPARLGMFVVCFLAFWTAWMCFTVYGNVVGQAARTVPVIAAMFGLAVMAASVSEVQDRRAGVFALAYILVRLLAVRIWYDRRDQGTVRVVVDWPIARVNTGLVPWIVSLWVGPPWQYGLWALGVAIDLVVIFAGADGRAASDATRRLVLMNTTSRGRPTPRAILAHVDAEHFGERLGLFIIIVLGEAVLTVTERLAEVPEWNLGVYSTVAGAFGLLAAVWALAFPGGFAGVPRLASGARSSRVVLLLHCLTAATLVVLADGIGEIVELADGEQPSGEIRWLLCGALMLFTIIGLVADPALWRRFPGPLLSVLAGLVGPLAIGWFGDVLTVRALIWLLALVVVVPLAGRLFPLGRLVRRRAD